LDLGKFSEAQLTEVEALVTPADFKKYCRSYLPPHLFWYDGLGFSDDLIDQYLGKFYIDRFGLTHVEVGLARMFFERREPDVVSNPTIASRRFFSHAYEKTVLDFCAFEYPNGHEGSFPLDCRPATGLPKKNPGCYGLFDELNGRDGDMEESNSSDREDEVKLDSIKRSFAL
jgi:hypothetical protein